MSELKPCPFCGGKARNISHASCDCCGKAFTGIIGCTICNAEVSHYDTEDEAIIAWNTRANEAEIRNKALEEAEKAIIKNCVFAENPNDVETQKLFDSITNNYLRAIRALKTKKE